MPIHRASKYATASRAICAGAQATSTLSKRFPTPLRNRRRSKDSESEALNLELCSLCFSLRSVCERDQANKAPRTKFEKQTNLRRRTPMSAKYVGQRVKRTEDPRLIKGLAHYVDDIRLPDILHVAFVRSVYAHARINSIDASAALAAPGVVAVYTGLDAAEKIGPVPCASALPGLKVPDHRVLATDKVYFVGHPIVAIVATDRYAARDAVELVTVDYEDLPAVSCV